MDISKDINHRNSIKGFFITFSQSRSVTKEQFYEKFSSVFSVDKAIAALESHKDGNPHIHLAVVLKESKTKTQLLSHFRGIYPDDYKRIDIKSLRSFSKSICYLTSPEKDKEVDLSPLMINCDLTSRISQKHKIVFQQLSNDPDHVKWYICYCSQCAPKYESFRNSQILEIFGDDPRIDRPIYRN